MYNKLISWTSLYLFANTDLSTVLIEMEIYTFNLKGNMITEYVKSSASNNRNI